MSSSRLCDSGRLSVLHLVASVGRHSGGLGPVAIGLAREQRALGHQVTIWCLDSATDAAEIARESELEDKGVVTFPILGPSWVGYSPAMERAAISEPGGSSYDIIHQHSIWMPISRVTNRWRIAFGRPTVVAPHGTLEAYVLRRSAWKKWLATLAYERENLRTASCLHATSTAEAASLRRYGLTNPIAVIPDGIPETWIHSNGDPDRFRHRFAIPRERRLLLFLSRLHPKKGVPLLLKALADLRQQLGDWLLVIGGPDERGYVHALRSLSRELNIEDLVHFVGPLFGQDKRDAFAASDIFVLPTHSENFGIVVAEALGAGVPVLTTRGAPWEELEVHHCGWWVDISTMAIRNALLDATRRSRDDLAAMGQRGKNLVAQKYTWPRIAQKSLELYQWLLGCSDRPDFVILD